MTDRAAIAATGCQVVPPVVDAPAGALSRHPSALNGNFSGDPAFPPAPPPWLAVPRHMPTRIRVQRSLIIIFGWSVNHAQLAAAVRNEALKRIIYGFFFFFLVRNNLAQNAAK